MKNLEELNAILREANTKLEAKVKTLEAEKVAATRRQCWWCGDFTTKPLICGICPDCQ